MLQIAIDNGYKSHDTSTCGLHVHINKKYFGNNDFEINNNINKMLLFFEFYKNEIMQFSRRSVSALHWCNFYSNYFEDLKRRSKKEICNIEKLASKKNNGNRYFAINLQNQNTIEIRIFRGSLKKETFFSVLEFVFNFAEIIKNNEVKKISLSKVINLKNKYLRDYFVEKIPNYSKNYLYSYVDNTQKSNNKIITSIIKDLASFQTNLIDILQDNINIYTNAKNKNYVEFSKNFVQNGGFVKNRKIFELLDITSDCIRLCDDFLNGENAKHKLRDSIIDFFNYQSIEVKNYNMREFYADLKKKIEEVV